MSAQRPDGWPGSLARPFVLLEDRLAAQPRGRLYRDPVSIVRCDSPDGVDAAFREIDTGRAAGLHAAGLFSYELGYALEPRLAPLMPPARTVPLLWFGLFEAPLQLEGRALDAAFAAQVPASIIDLTPAHDRDEHMRKVREILGLIGAGDLYQANLTFPMRFRYPGDPLALYGALRAQQPVAHAGLIALNEATILSVSPELFIEATGGVATTRPMKGTAARRQDPQRDAQARTGLAQDPKQRAENLMIVDLLRNDLARISEPGSVQVPALFTVETFPTFHALTSTVTSRLRPGVTLREWVAALFPCGSVVGAPKIRAAEAIRRLEGQPRGVYTGAIGAIGPNGDLSFNVAIRTAVIGRDGMGVYGVGGGVVADSDPGAEYEEALLKARVLSRLAEDYGLIETFRWSAAQGFVRLGDHLDRMTASAVRLGFAFDRPQAERRLAELAEAWRGQGSDRRVRLQLERTGALVITEQSIPAASAAPLSVGLASGRLDAGDPFLLHKTTRRDIHEAAFAEAADRGLDEAILLNRSGRVADGSRNSVFIQRAGRWITPPISDGALPGVLRATLIAAGRAVEGEVSLDALRAADGLALGNSLHGLRTVSLAEQVS